MAEYTYETSFTPRYSDIDVNGHVNQAKYLSYLEQARVGYWDEVVGIRHDRAPVAIVHQEIDYRAPITLDHEVTVRQRIAGMGTSSFDIEYEVLADDAVAAKADVVLLALDRETGEAIPIPDSWREPIREHEALEEDGVE
jgi:acyl-CoA thioester hydrolase